MSKGKVPVKATFAPVVDDEEKAALIFDVLSAEPRPRLSRREIEEATQMSTSQVRAGWAMLRRTLGPDIAVVEAHRQDTVYYLSEEIDDGTNYLIWQIKHAYARIYSIGDTLHQVQHVANGRYAGLLQEAAASQQGTWVSLRNLLRSAGEQSGMTPKQIEAMLTGPERKRAKVKAITP